MCEDIVEKIFVMIEYVGDATLLEELRFYIPKIYIHSLSDLTIGFCFSSSTLDSEINSSELSLRYQTSNVFLI